MTKIDKLIRKVLEGRVTSYEDAERILLRLGFEVEVCGAHHVFRKKGYVKNVSIKKRSRLLPYQLKNLQEVLKDHEY